MNQCQEFAALAESKCGKSASIFQKQFGLPCNGAWSAAFVSSCALEFGVSSTLIAKSSKCQELEHLSTSKQHVSNPCKTINAAKEAPQVGDIAIISWSNSGKAEHCGVVCRVDKSSKTVSIVSGSNGASNVDGFVQMSTYSNYGDCCVTKYLRPQWQY